MKRTLLGLPVLLALAACSSGPEVKTDSDPAVNFGQYHTYNWLTQPDGASPLVAQRIMDNVNAALQAKGWQQSAQQPDVTLAAHVATQQRQRMDTFYDAPVYGGWGWRGGYGMGMSTTTVSTYNVGTLVVDMFDTRTKRGIWRGSASGTVPSSPEKVNAAVQAGVQKMFAAFPPGSAPQ